jgi:hypothetical protein
VFFTHHDAKKQFIVGKERILTKSSYDKRLAQQKSGEKRRKTAITSTPIEEIVEHNAPTYAEKQPDITEARRTVKFKILGQQLWCLL